MMHIEYISTQKMLTGQRKQVEKLLTAKNLSLSHWPLTV